MKKCRLPTLFSLVEQECHEAYEDDSGEQSECNSESVELANFCPETLASSGNIQQWANYVSTLPPPRAFRVALYGVRQSTIRDQFGVLDWSGTPPIGVQSACSSGV